MKKVTAADSLVTINHYKNLLEAEGIPAFIKNEFLGSIVGEMPFQEVWPQLWVKNDLDLDRATEIIANETTNQPAPGPAWLCRQCATENEGQFAVCWNCGTASDAPD